MIIHDAQLATYLKNCRPPKQKMTTTVKTRNFGWTNKQRNIYDLIGEKPNLWNRSKQIKLGKAGNQEMFLEPTVQEILLHRLPIQWALKLFMSLPEPFSNSIGWACFLGGTYPEYWRFRAISGTCVCWYLIRLANLFVLCQTWLISSCFLFHCMVCCIIVVFVILKGVNSCGAIYNVLAPFARGFT